MAEMVGMLGTAGFLGSVGGTLLGDVLLGATPIEWPQVQQMFIVAGLLGLAAFPFAWAATSGEKRPHVCNDPPLLQVLRRHHPGMVLAVGVAMGMGLGLPSTFLRTFAAELDIPRIGLFFTVYAVAAIITRILTRRWSERFGNRPMILLGMAGMAASQLSLLLVHVEWQLIAPAIVFGCSHAVLFPAVVAAGSGTFPRRHRGVATLLVLSTWDVGLLLAHAGGGRRVEIQRIARPTAVSDALRVDGRRFRGRGRGLRGEQPPRRGGIAAQNWPGTGPFFGEKTHFADKPLTENMDLSPSRGAEGDSPIFATFKQPRIAGSLAPRKLGQFPHKRLFLDDRLVVVDRAAEALVEIDLRLVAEQRSGERDVGLALADIAGAGGANFASTFMPSSLLSVSSSMSRLIERPSAALIVRPAMFGASAASRFACTTLATNAKSRDWLPSP